MCCCSNIRWDVFTDISISNRGTNYISTVCEWGCRLTRLTKESQSHFKNWCKNREERQTFNRVIQLHHTGPLEETRPLVTNQNGQNMTDSCCQAWLSVGTLVSLGKETETEEQTDRKRKRDRPKQTPAFTLHGSLYCGENSGPSLWALGSWLEKEGVTDER